MIMFKYYEFIDYISNRQLEEAYQLELPDTLDEIYTNMGIKDPHESLVRRYWADKVLENWRAFWCLEWLYSRTGRPEVEGLDIKTTIECCKVHLQACMLNSYENCDLLEKNSYRRCLTNCGCPKCYNNRLDGWRKTDV
jgi:hypothetical protein